MTLLNTIYNITVGDLVAELNTTGLVEAVVPAVTASPSDQFLSTGIDRIDADLTVEPFRVGDGHGVVNADIAIVDTGVGEGDLSNRHPDLNVFYSKQFIPGIDDSDHCRHGTQVAGIAARI